MVPLVESVEISLDDDENRRKMPRNKALLAQTRVPAKIP
jgi:hypothetical protein